VAEYRRLICFFAARGLGLLSVCGSSMILLERSAKNTVKAHLSSPFRDEGKIY